MKIINYVIPAIVLLIYGCGNGNDRNLIEATGTIETTNVTISSRVAGEIKEIRNHEGSKVSRGDTILLIDNETLQLQLQQAEASRKIAEAQYQLAVEGARKEDISQAESALRQAEINYKQALTDKERMEGLYKSNAVTGKQYEDAVNRAGLTEAQLNYAKESLQKIKNISRPEEIKQAEANLQRAKATEELIKKNIRDSYVTSPINGVIIEQFFEEGEFVSPMSSLVKVSDLSEAELNIYLSEEELPLVKPGSKVDVKIDAFPEKNYEGKVVYISPESEFTPKNIQTKDERTKLVYRVKVKIPNPDFELKAGMPADAYINLQEE